MSLNSSGCSLRGVKGFLGRAISVALVLTVVPLGESLAMASKGPLQTQEQKIEQWKRALNKRGTGERSKWEVRMQDGRKIKGYASEIAEDGFILIESKTKESIKLAFSDLTSLKRQGSAARTLRNVAIGAGVGLAVVLTALYFGLRGD